MTDARLHQMSETWPEWAVYACFERAAILEYDAGMPREEADEAAFRMLQEELFRRAEGPYRVRAYPAPARARQSRVSETRAIYQGAA